MSTAALEAAMAGMGTARTTFESSTSRVRDELPRLQEGLPRTRRTPRRTMPRMIAAARMLARARRWRAIS